MAQQQETLFGYPILEETPDMLQFIATQVFDPNEIIVWKPQLTRSNTIVGITRTGFLVYNGFPTGERLKSDEFDILANVASYLHVAQPWFPKHIFNPRAPAWVPSVKK